MNRKCLKLENAASGSKELQKIINTLKDEHEKKEEELEFLLSDYKSRLSIAEEQLASSTPLPESPNVSLIDPSIFSDLRTEVEMQREHIAHLKEENSRVKAENDEMSHLSHSLRLEITELKNTLEEKDDELSSYRESMRQANEEIKMLNLEMDDDDPKVDVAPKGNSLFSEVEDRRHIAEDKLKKVQTKLEEFKALHERKALELNKLRMQNVHLMNMTSSSNSAKCDQSHVDRLQALLQAEKERNKDLMGRLSNDTTAEDFAKNLMKQSLFDSEMLSELGRQMSTLEKQMTKLKAENFTLKMRLNEKAPSKTAPQARKPKEQKFITENIIFSPKKSKSPPEPSKSQTMLDPFNDVTNKTEDKKATSTGKEDSKKKVRFDVAESESIETPEKKPLKRMPKVHDEHKIIDADEECRKMNEQCAQQ